MEGYYVFSDECGSYNKKRSANYLATHPFYVRSSVTISFDDYVELEGECNTLRKRMGIDSSAEIKWSETGQRFNNRVSKGLEEIPTEVLFKYIEEVIRCSSKLDSIKLFFSVFDNSVNKEIDTIKMLKMHLQNALQRANMDGNDWNAFMTLIIDDIGEKTNKRMKEIIHAMMEEGDFQRYERVKKSILTDYSHHCVGLQIADYSAGIFTNCLRRMANKDGGYDFANTLFYNYLYKKLRNDDNRIPCYRVYGYGIKEVPNGCGKEICKQISESIEKKMCCDLEEMMRSI